MFKKLKTIHDAKIRLTQLQIEYDALNQKYKDLEQRYLRMNASWSWRLTLVFRKLLSPNLKLKVKSLIGKNKNKNILKNCLIKNLDSTKIPYSELLMKINLHQTSSPKASIIVCIHNQLNYTINCLEALAHLHDSHSFEVIIVDDQSTDLSPLLAELPGLRYIRMAERGGFLKSANEGARNAKGEFLVFLNNDTIVLNGWLDNLLQVFRNFSDAGLVGSKFLEPNGLIQEAGAFIFNSGQAMHYGRGQNALDSAFNYVREVHYCSGASIAIKKDLFLSVEMFDERYAPCYYEDVDLAFKVRSQNLKVYYSPFSQLFHFEGISHGKNPVQGFKKYQELNRNTLFNKWEEVLQDFPSYREMDKSKLRNIATNGKKRLLILDHHVPRPDKDAGSYRMQGILKLLLNRFDITFIPMDTWVDLRNQEVLCQMGIECLDHRSLITTENYLKENGSAFSYVIISRPDVAKSFLTDIKKHCTNAKIIYDTVDLHWIRLTRESEIQQCEKSQKYFLTEAKTYENLESHAMKSSHQTWVVSSVEKEILNKKMNNLDVKIVPIIYESADIKNKTFQSSQDILFVGDFNHRPNLDAFLFLTNTLWPKIRKRLPNVRLYIVGPNLPEHFRLQVTKSWSDEILVLGHVHDLREIFEMVRILLAPLRFGAGLKGKIGLALRYGVPVITTSIGAEGYDVKGNELLIADSPEALVNATVQLYEDPIFWEKSQLEGHQLMTRYTPAFIGQHLEELLPS